VSDRPGVSSGGSDRDVQRRILATLLVLRRAGGDHLGYATYTRFTDGSGRSPYVKHGSLRQDGGGGSPPVDLAAAGLRVDLAVVGLRADLAAVGLRRTWRRPGGGPSGALSFGETASASTGTTFRRSMSAANGRSPREACGCSPSAATNREPNVRRKSSSTIASTNSASSAGYAVHDVLETRRHVPSGGLSATTAPATIRVLPRANSWAAPGRCRRHSLDVERRRRHAPRITPKKSSTITI